jgi:hypothetical protein
MRTWRMTIAVRCAGWRSEHMFLRLKGVFYFSLQRFAQQTPWCEANYLCFGCFPSIFAFFECLDTAICSNRSSGFRTQESALNGSPSRLSLSCRSCVMYVLYFSKSNAQTAVLACLRRQISVAVHLSFLASYDIRVLHNLHTNELIYSTTNF